MTKAATIPARHRLAGDEPLRPRRNGAIMVTVVVAGIVLLKGLAPERLVLPDQLSDFATLAISVVVESLPFVFIGVIVSVAVQLYVPQRVLLAILPRQPLPRRAVLSLLGVLLPVCECGNVPMARGLITRGVTVPEAMTFLLAAPILNPITILTTYQAFGFDDGILAWRVFGGFVIANGVGWLLSRHPEPTRLLTPAFAATCDARADRRTRSARRALQLFAAETSTMLPALFVGAALAALIQVGVPRSTLLNLGQNPVVSVAAMMGLAFTIAICSNVDAFFALAFRGSFSAGSVLAFLVLGPMLDVKMVILLRTTFTRRLLLLVAALVGGATFVLGLAVNLGG